MSNDEEKQELVGPREDKKAAAWAWPVILISVFFIGWLVNVIPTGALESEEAEVSGAELGSAADLALLQIQSQAIIASASMDADSATQAIQTLREQTSGTRARAAVLLLEDFIDIPDSKPIAWLRELKKSKGAPSWLEEVEISLNTGVTDQQRNVLRRELGWFAELAAGPDRTEPVKAREIRQRSTGVILLVMLCLFGAAGVILVGGVFLIELARKRRLTGRAMKLDPETFPRGVMLEVFALYLCMIALGELGSIFFHGGISMVGYVLSIGVPLGWPLFRGHKWKPFLHSLGWHRGDGVWKEIGCGILGYSGVLAIASIGMALTWILTMFLGMFPGGGAEAAAKPAGPQPHPILGWMFSGDWIARILCLLLAAVLAPLLEEALFRGALHRYLRGQFGFFASALITGVIFAALHPQGWMAIPALGAIGIGFSLLREWRDSLIAPMVAHSINNGTLIVAVWVAL